MRSDWKPVIGKRAFEATFRGQQFRVEKKTKNFLRWRVLKWSNSQNKWLDRRGFMELSAAQKFAESLAEMEAQR